ncbi:MAG: ROK family protein [Marinoscillum sp.]
MTIGVDLGATQLRAALCQGDQLFHKCQTYLENKDVLEKTLDQITDFLAPLIKPGTSGIGIGVPAIVDIATGTVYNSNNISSWQKVELKRTLEMRLSLPVHVNNDANSFTYGAYKYGLATKCRNMVGVTLGTGLGVGLVLNKQPYFGSNCGAGEIGLNPYKEKTYELYTSSEYFIREHGISAQTAHEMARTGSKEHLIMWKRYGEHLGEFIKTIVTAYDPEVIAFGGSIAQAFALFEPGIRIALKDFIFTESIKKLQLTTVDQKDISILGAAALFEDYEQELIDA